MNKKKVFRPRDILPWLLIHLHLIITAIIVLYPVLWIIGAAVSPVRGSPGAVTQDTLGFLPIPRAFTFDNFRRLFSEHNFGLWYRNTLTIAVLSCAGTVVVQTFMGYVFARLKFAGRKMGLLTIMVISMFPSFLAMTAIYVIFLTFGWLDSIYPLVLLNVGGGIPGTMWLMRGYMLNIPKSLDEAAYMDGATKMQVFTKVIFPLSKPIITFVGFNAFMGPWMDYIFPRLVLRSSENFTLAIGLFDLSNPASGSYDITAFTAAAIIIGVPFAIIFYVFQNNFALGMTAGANKGE